MNQIPLDYSNPKQESNPPRRWLFRSVLFLSAILFGVYSVAPMFNQRSFDPPQGPGRSDLSQLNTALNVFLIDNDRYPTTQEGLKALVTNPGSLPDWKQCFDKIPVDPWGRPYIYMGPATIGYHYHLSCAGPDGIPGNLDDLP